MMGRMLDTLSRRDAGAQNAAAPKPPLQAVWPGDEPPLDGAGDAAMPFIEVGGREILSSEGLTAQSASAGERQTPATWMTVRFRPVAAARSNEHANGHFARELVVFHHPEHSASRQYVELSERLTMHLPSADAKSLLFSATEREAGTTTVLLNTALSIAQSSDRRVVVVDAALHRPAIAERLGLPRSPGLAEVLEERVALEDALQQTGSVNLTALTAGAADSRDTLRNAALKVHTVLDQLSVAADLVLVDGPVWDGRPGTIELGRACDALYLCVPEVQKEGAHVLDLVALLPELNAPLCGCILTQR